MILPLVSSCGQLSPAPWWAPHWDIRPGTSAAAAPRCEGRSRWTLRRSFPWIGRQAMVMFMADLVGSNYPSINVSMHQRIYQSIYVSMYRSIYLSIYQTIYLSNKPSINLSIYVSMYLCIYLSIYLYLSIYRSIDLSRHMIVMVV